MSEPDFWKEQERAKEVSQQRNNLKGEIEKREKINKDLADLEGLVDLHEAEPDLEKELEKKYLELEKLISKEELKIFLSGKYDRSNALLSIYAGAGGTEAQDWAEMLLRMYLRYSQSHGFAAKVLHIHSGQEAGIKNVTFEVSGPYAYGYLKGEAGVHRLVRLSPFNADNLRHTSFALVEVLPELEEIPEIKVNPSDLRIDTYRASGPGGQYVNKTETAVRITHLPTNIVVNCQSERLQGANKERAMKMLLNRIYQYQISQTKKEKEKLKGPLVSVGWGNQIRSYVLHPYKMVKDLRTGIETSDVEAVLDGNIDQFIEAEIKLKT